MISKSIQDRFLSMRNLKSPCRLILGLMISPFLIIFEGSVFGNVVLGQSNRYFRNFALAQTYPTTTDNEIPREYSQEEINFDKNNEYIENTLKNLDLGNYAVVIEEANRILKSEPKNGYALNFRGIAFANMGMNAEAIEDYKNAIKYQPQNAAIFNNLGVALKDYGDKSKQPMLIEESIEVLSEAVKLSPDFPGIYVNRGNSLMHLARFEESVDNYNKAIELDPEYIAAYSNRSNAFLYLNRPLDAIKDASKAIELDEGDALAYFIRSLAYDQIGERETSKQDLIKAKEVANSSEFESYASSYHSITKLQKTIESQHRKEVISMYSILVLVVIAGFVYAMKRK